MNRILKIGLPALAVALFVVGCGKSPAPAGASETTAEAKDRDLQAAPAFTLTDHSGKTHNVADYKGKTVVLEWINPECPFVIRHHETTTTMADLAGAYADKGVVWLGINTTSHYDHAKNKAWAERLELPYPVLNDSDGTVGRKYGVTRTPELVIIDKAGNIAYHGAIDDDPRGNKPDATNYVKNALDEVLAGKAVSVPKTEPYGCTIKWAQ